MTETRLSVFFYATGTLPWFPSCASLHFTQRNRAWDISRPRNHGEHWQWKVSSFPGFKPLPRQLIIMYCVVMLDAWHPGMDTRGTTTPHNSASEFVWPTFHFSASQKRCFSGHFKHSRIRIRVHPQKDRYIKRFCFCELSFEGILYSQICPIEVPTETIQSVDKYTTTTCPGRLRRLRVAEWRSRQAAKSVFFKCSQLL